MSDWTPTERTIKTPNGIIRYGGPCCDTYPNMETYDQGGGHTILVLQRPAMKAFKAAEVRYGKRTKRPSGQRDILVSVGTNRTCATQTALYRKDSRRYADPRITGHTRGLAIDLRTDQPNFELIRSLLRLEGWKQTRPEDEPWHMSYFVTI